MKMNNVFWCDVPYSLFNRDFKCFKSAIRIRFDSLFSLINLFHNILYMIQCLCMLFEACNLNTLEHLKIVFVKIYSVTIFTFIFS